MRDFGLGVRSAGLRPAVASDDVIHHVDGAWAGAAFDPVHRLDAECFELLPPQVAIVRQRRRARLATLFHVPEQSEQASRFAERPCVCLRGDIDEPYEL